MLKEVLDIVAQGGPVGIAGVVLWFHLNAVKRYEKQLEEERKERRDAQAVVNKFVGDIPLLTKAIDDLTEEVELSNADR